MLQPRTYPELLGKALVLEADPFITMADDDNPWAEGLFLTLVLGVLVAVARLVSGLVLTASLPPPETVAPILMAALRQVGFAWNEVESWFALLWPAVSFGSGYGAGWSRLLLLIAVPFAFIVQWFFFGLIGYGAGRLLGGRGSLNQTLGTTALIVAPQALSLLAVIPFVSVSSLLLAVWSILIVYRALAVAHGLPWQRALWATLLPVAALLILILLFSALLGSLAVLSGGF